jgi:transposase
MTDTVGEGSAAWAKEAAMSLQPQTFSPIPEETRRVAEAAFPKGSPYLRVHAVLGSIYADEQFATLYPACGQHAEAPWRLALTTVLQFAEGLSDQQAADAVRSRIDWKYVLALPLEDPGFDASVLCEFRARLLAGSAETWLLDTLLSRCREHGFLKVRGKQRTDSTQVLAAIRILHRLECVGETMRQALNALAVVGPDWLRAWVPDVWYDRYARAFTDYRLPAGRDERYTLAEVIGADGFYLLGMAYAPRTPAWVREVPAIQVLRQVWLQQFYAPAERVRWRSAEDLPPAALLICTPYDPEARYSKKRDTVWTGYKVHLTETCDAETPHLLTNVETTLATTADFELTEPIQAHLAGRDLLPSEHYVDAGYMSIEHVVRSQRDHGIDLVGPVPDETSWQAQAQEGFATASFAVDWEAKRATCPQGQHSSLWLERTDHRGHGVVHIKFAKAACQACPVRTHCTHAASEPRSLMIRDREHFAALQAARQRQTTDTFKAQYTARAGVEGTISQAVRTGAMRRARYLGLAKTRLEHLLMATGLNVLRLGTWLSDQPRPRGRPSPFVVLGAAA